MVEQQPLFKPVSKWVPPTEFPRLGDEKILAWDTETRDPNLEKLGPGWARNDVDMVGFSIATPERSWYFPMKHRDGGNLDARQCKRFAADLLKRDTTKIMFNAQYDMGVFKKEGLEVVGKIIDPMGAAAMLDGQRFTYGLDPLLKDFCGLEKDKRALTDAANAYGFNPVADLWKMHSSHAGEYGEYDAASLWPLWMKFKPMLEEDEMMPLFELEMELYYVWVDMTYRGVKIDEDWIAQSRAKLVAERAEIQKRFPRGHLDVMNATDVARILEGEGIVVPKTAKTKKPSITKDWLEMLPAKTQVIKDIQRCRKLDKIVGTFIDGMITNHLVNGRLHPHWNPLKNDKDAGAVTGRVTSSHPSAQVFPKRDPEFGVMIRGAFVPDDGDEWVSADMSQQEPRWYVHYAGMMKCRGVKRMLEAYAKDPRTDYHTICAQFSGLQRKESKDMNQGFAYGMGQKKSEVSLQALGVSKERAVTVYETFHEELPYVKQLTEIICAHARQRGWVRSALGRKFKFDLWEPQGNFSGMSREKGDRYNYCVPQKRDVANMLRGNEGEHPDWRGRSLVRAFIYRAPNRVIQGTSADQIKKAMLDIWKAGGPTMLLQVHDELNFSNSMGDKGVEIVRECMENSISPTLVPFLVDIDRSKRWLAGKEDD